MNQRPGVIARTIGGENKNSARASIRPRARKLGVDYVLEGSVREASSRVRITARASSRERQMHVWSESFDRGLKDVSS